MMHTRKARQLSCLAFFIVDTTFYQFTLPPTLSKNILKVFDTDLSVTNTITLVQGIEAIYREIILSRVVIEKTFYSL